MKKGGKIVLGIMALGIIGAIFGSKGGDSKKETASKVGEVSSDVTMGDSIESDDLSAPKSDATEAASIQAEYKVGDILESKDMKIVYVASGEYVSDNEFMQPKEGNKYIFFKFYCENISDSDKNISYFDFNCYADGYSAEAFYNDENALSATLSPGRTTMGCAYFEVPENSEDIQLEYETNFWTEEKIHFVYEGDKDSGFVPEGNSSALEETYAVGDIVETKTLRISYLSCGDYISDNEFIQPAEGNKFIYCEFEFENIGDSDEHISSMLFDCYADGASCESHYLDSDLDATLSAGKKTKGKVTFEVPESANIVEVEYVDNFWTSKRIVFTVK